MMRTSSPTKQLSAEHFGSLLRSPPSPFNDDRRQTSAYPSPGDDTQWCAASPTSEASPRRIFAKTLQHIPYDVLGEVYSFLPVVGQAALRSTCYDTVRSFDGAVRNELIHAAATADPSGELRDHSVSWFPFGRRFKGRHDKTRDIVSEHGGFAAMQAVQVVDKAHGPRLQWSTQFLQNVSQRNAERHRMLLLRVVGVTNVSIPEVATHPHFQHIRKLDLSSFPLNDEDLRHLVHLRHLMHLDLQARVLSDAAMPYLVALQELRVLNLAECETITAAGLRQLSGLRKLEDLNLNLCQVSEITTMGLAGLLHLKHLSMINCLQVDDAALVPLRHAVSLESLKLSGCRRVSDSALMLAIGGMHYLQRLDLSRCNVSHTGLKHLTSLQRLEQLNLGRCPHVTDEACEPIGQLRALRELDLRYCNITDAGLKQLKTLAQLRYIDLSGCAGITDAGVEAHLAALRHLHFADVRECKLKDTTVDRMRPAALAILH
jgi:hypothetical protein